MSTSAEVAGRVSNAGVQEPREPSLETVLRPPVDILEDAEGITLHADMPGVSKERVNVHLDGTTLLLEGTVRFANAAQVAADERTEERRVTTRYRRRFALGRELEPNRIEATVKDGVLAVRIPKRAESRLRRIEIQ